MNLTVLKSIFIQNTRNKIFIISSELIGIFFLFSLISKMLTFSDWLSFNYDLIGNWLGYINSFTILFIELFFGVSFLLIKINRKIILACIIFILTLTLIVMFNKNLFQTCMCFGRLISIKPDITFIVKNSILILTIVLTYFTCNKTNCLIKN